MSDIDLPDNLNDWPEDPYELFSVSSDVSDRDARRAYHRLIRKFKPEHHPEEFQRIREAYEVLQKHLAWRSYAQESWDDEDSVDETDDDLQISDANTRSEGTTSDEDPSSFNVPIQNLNDSVDDLNAELDDDQDSLTDDDIRLTDVTLQNEDDVPATNPSENSSKSPKHKQRRQPVSKPSSQSQSSYPLSVEEACESIWNSACNGEESLAYVRLLSLREQHGNQEEILLRLYWLLKTNSALDEQRTACDWLVVGLEENKVTGRLKELYRSELFQSAEEAVSDRCASLLQKTESAGSLYDLLESRWQAVDHLKEYHLILRDIEFARPRMIYEHDELWGQLLIKAIDYLAWVQAPQIHDAVERYYEEVEEMSHLHHSHGELLDRLDLLSVVSRDWHRTLSTGHAHRKWLNLIPLSWSRPMSEMRQHVLPLLQEVGTDPLGALARFDAIALMSPAMTAQLGNMVRDFKEHDYQYHWEQRSWEDLQRIVIRFLQQYRGVYYQAIRKDLLRFCLRESISPDSVGYVCTELPLNWFPPDESITDRIEDDGPIRYVYRAFHAFWG